MHIGYNTNGFAHHKLEDAISVLAEIGYRSIAITLDVRALNPFDPDYRRELNSVQRSLEHHELHCVIETGSRFILDPRRKHAPTLLDMLPADRGRRRDFLVRAIDIAQYLHADAVSFWSGAKPDGVTEKQATTQLVDECRRLADGAARHQVRLAFEPEPGMFIDTMERFAALHAAVNHPLFGLTLDVGHVHCLNEGRPADHIRNWKEKLFNVHIEDMKRGQHEHLAFGEGEMDFPPIFAALHEINYAYGLHVELSRHSHDAVNVARESYRFLEESMQT